jgi:hypothetical protein
VITRTRSTMSVVTLEDLQGSLEVVVFPRLYEQTGPIWQEGAILLVAGRVDHRGEEVSLLADVVVPWDEAVGRGPEAFAREVAAGDRGAMRRRQPVPVGPGGPAAAGGRGGDPYPSATVPMPAGGPPSGANGNGNGAGHGDGHGTNGAFDPRNAPLGRRPEIEYVSPLQGGALPEGGPLERAGEASPVSTLPRIAPADPVGTYPEQAGERGMADHDVEPALPDEARSRVAAEAGADTAPMEALLPGSALHVRFAAAPAAQVVEAFRVITQLVRERPGDTEVVVHVPAPGGNPQPMPLPRRVAYDADLLAEVRRRLGDTFVQLSVAPPA